MAGPARKRIAVVINARAGALLAAQPGATPLAALFAAEGLEPSFIPPEAGSLPERMQAALAEAPDAVVVAGGDGTVACAAQALRGSDTPLGILPFGTVNLLAKDLGLPVGDTPAAVRALAAWNAQKIDMGEVNGNVFLCAVMLGLPATLGRHREETRGARTKFLARIPIALLRAIWRRAALRGMLEVGESRVRVQASAATVTVNPMRESSGLDFRREKLDGGTLVFYEVRARGVLDWARFVLRVLARRWRRDTGLHEWAGPRMVFSQPRKPALHVMVDGEILLLPPPLAFTCHPVALTVLRG